MLLPMGDMVTQQAADWVIAIAYFSIPMEIMYFFCKHPIFLDNRARLITSLFVSFISLCGITHAFHAIRDYHVMAFLRAHSLTSVTDEAVSADPTVHHWTLVLSISKILTALVSVSTVLVLLVIIPQVLAAVRYIPELEEGLRRKIIELNEARAAAESANTRKGEFMAFLCHEIRNPLHVITANIDFLIESANAAATQPLLQLEPYVDDGGQALMQFELQQQMQQQAQLQQQQQSQGEGEGPAQSPVSEFDPLGPAAERSEQSSSTPLSSPVDESRPQARHHSHPHPPPALTVQTGAAPAAAAAGSSSGIASSSYPLYVIRDGASSGTSPADQQQQQQQRGAEVVVSSQRGQTPATAPAASGSKRRTWPSVDYTPRTQMGDALPLALGVVPQQLQQQHFQQQLQLLRSAPGQLSLEQRQYCRAINHAAELMVSICNDVLDIARLESGVIVFEHLAVDLPLLCETFVSLSRPQALARGIRIELEWAAPPLDSRYVYCDPTRLHQVFLQLISNAIKFAKEADSGRGEDEDDAEAQQPPQPGASLTDILRPPPRRRRRRGKGAGSSLSSQPEIKFRVRSWFPPEMGPQQQQQEQEQRPQLQQQLSPFAEGESPSDGAGGASASRGHTLDLPLQADSPRREPSPRMQALTLAAQAEAAEVVAAAQAAAVPPVPLLRGLSHGGSGEPLDADGFPVSERQALLSPPSASSSSTASASAGDVAAALAVQPSFAAFSPAAQGQYSRARTIANTVLSVNAKAIQQAAAAAAAAAAGSSNAVASPAAHGSNTPPLHSHRISVPGSSPVPTASPPLRLSHGQGHSPSHAVLGSPGPSGGVRSSGNGAAPRSMPPLVPRSSLSPATSSRHLGSSGGGGSVAAHSSEPVSAATHLQHAGAPAKPGYAAVKVQHRGGCNTGLGRERLAPTADDMLSSGSGSASSAGFGSGSGAGSGSGSSGRVSRHASFNSDQDDGSASASSGDSGAGAERAHLIDAGREAASAGGRLMGSPLTQAQGEHKHAPLGYDPSASGRRPFGPDDPLADDNDPNTDQSGQSASAAGGTSFAPSPPQPAPEYCWVQFEVIDNGVGMSAEVLRHVFLPYSEHKLRTYRSQGGTGLGLSICKEIVNQLEGELNVHSIEGEGSTFVVRLRFQVARQADVLQAYFNAQGNEMQFEPPPLPQAVPVPSVGSESGSSSAGGSTASQSRRGSADRVQLQPEHISVEMVEPARAAASAQGTASSSSAAAASASAADASASSASPFGTPPHRPVHGHAAAAVPLDLLSSPLADSQSGVPQGAIPSNSSAASSAHMSSNFAYMPFSLHMGAAELSGHVLASAPAGSSLQTPQLAVPSTAHSASSSGGGSSSGPRTPTTDASNAGASVWPSPGAVSGPAAARAQLALRLATTPSSPYSGLQSGSVAALSSVATASPLSSVGASPLSAGVQLPPALASFPSHGAPSSTPPHSGTSSSRSGSLSGSGLGLGSGALGAPFHRILVVDDNEVNRKLLRRMMSSLAYEVDTAENGLLAVEAVKRNMSDWPRPASLSPASALDPAAAGAAAEKDGSATPGTGTGTGGTDAASAHVQAQQEREYEANRYSCIVMDLSMPVMNGYEATTAIRALGFTAPILALTANALTEERQKAFDAGCSEFCTKPIRKHELVQLMARFCGHDHPAQQAAMAAAAVAAAHQSHFAGRQRSSPSPSGLMLASSGNSSGAHSPASSTLLMPATSTTAGPYHPNSTQPYAQLGGAGSGSAASSSTHSPVSRLTGGGSSSELMQFAPLGAPPGNSPRTGPTLLPTPALRLGSRGSSASSASGSGSNQFLSRPPLAVHPTIGIGGGGQGSIMSGERDRGSGGSSGGSPMLFNAHGRSVSAASTPMARDGTQRHSADAVVGATPGSGRAPTSATGGVGSGASSKRGGSDGLLPSGQTAGGIPAVPRPSPPLLSPSGGSMNLRRQLMLERGYSASAASEASLNALPRSPRRRTILSPSGAGVAASPSSAGGAGASPSPPAPVSASAALETPHGADSDVSSPASSNTASASPPAPAPGTTGTPINLAPFAELSPQSAATRTPTHARARSRGAINMGLVLGAGAGAGGSGGGSGGLNGTGSSGGVDSSLLSAIRAQQEHYQSLSPASQQRAIRPVEAVPQAGAGASPTSLLTPRNLALVAEDKGLAPPGSD